MNNFTYTVKNGIYINLTNRCTNACTFCIRNEGDGVYGSNTLWLEHEPSVAEVLDDLKKYDFHAYDEIVFCGYGEPTIRLETLCEVARGIKERRPDMPIRINTNGQANLIAGKDITPMLEGLIDTVSVSMNTADAQSYVRTCRPVGGEKAYQALLDFGLAASGHVPHVVYSVVRTTLPDTDIPKCEELAKKYGGILRVREFD